MRLAKAEVVIFSIRYSEYELEATEFQNLGYRNRISNPVAPVYLWHWQWTVQSGTYHVGLLLVFEISAIHCDALCKMLVLTFLPIQSLTFLQTHYVLLLKI
jgi:hypothetical protein